MGKLRRLGTFHEYWPNNNSDEQEQEPSIVRMNQNPHLQYLIERVALIVEYQLNNDNFCSFIEKSMSVMPSACQRVQRLANNGRNSLQCGHTTATFALVEKYPKWKFTILGKRWILGIWLPFLATESAVRIQTPLEAIPVRTSERDFHYLRS